MPFNISNITEYDATLLNLLTQNLPDMLWIKDLDGIYIYANKAICDGLLMAKDIKEPIGKGDVFFALREREAHKDKPDWHTFGELCFNSDQEVIDNNKPMKFEEYGNVKGKLLYLEVNKAPYYDKDGNIIGTVGSGRDITELKLTQIKLEKSEYELEEINKNLEQRVIEEVEKTKQIQEQLSKSEKMAAMGEMIGNIAHQWRQPLSVISTASTGMIMQKEFNSLSDEDLIKNCEVINDNAQYLSKTIDDFSKFIKGDKSASDFNLKNDTDSFLKLVDSTIKNHHLDVVLSLNEDINVHGYPNELIQCFINIFNNAKDALIENNEENDRYIFISQEIIDNHVIIKFKDNAGGIPEDIINKIFEPYFTTKHQSQGTGLGLHMTYNLIVDGMSGTIEAHNINYEYNGKEYTGAEFTISLPMS